VKLPYKFLVLVIDSSLLPFTSRSWLTSESFESWWKSEVKLLVRFSTRDYLFSCEASVSNWHLEGAKLLWNLLLQNKTEIEP